MSTVVDNRVVEMRFDNAQFEKGVATTNQSLDKLKDSLNLQDSAKGVEDVANKFSLMQVAVITAVANITSKITDMGLALAKSLTIDQVTAGFSKYEQELKSVQVIMNATGEGIDNVTERLRKLAWYTDETSYSYDSMVNNISKFTSQGISLEQSEKAMEGIANMAGFAGASVEDATHAMDGFSKAMAAGSMKLQNWKWIQTAHMETVQTKQAFIDAAVACGTLVKEGDKYYTATKKNQVSTQSFTETLKDGWLNAKVMNKALGDMGSYSDVVYNFQQGYKDLTGETLSCSEAMDKLDNVTGMTTDELLIYGKSQGLVSDSVNATTISSEELVKIQKDLSKWTNSIAKKGFEAAQQYRTFSDAIEATKDAASSQFKEIFANLFGNAEESKELWSELGDAMNDLFVGPLYDYVEIFQEFHDEFGGFELTLKAVKDIIGGMRTVIEPIREALGELIPKPTAQQIADFVKRLSYLTESLKLSEEASSGLKNILLALKGPITVVKEAITFVVKLVGALTIVINLLIQEFLEVFSSGEKVNATLEKLLGHDNYVKLMDAWSAATTNLSKVFSQLGSIVKLVFDRISNSKAAAGVMGTLASAAKVLGDVLLNSLIFALNLLSKIDLSGIINSLDELLSGKKTLAEIGSNVVQGLINGLKEGIPKIIAAAKNIGTQIIETIKDVLGINSPSKVAIAIGGFLIAGLVIGISQYVPELKNVLNTVADGFAEFFEKIDIGRVVLIGFAAAVTTCTTVILAQTARIMGGVADVLKGAAQVEKSVSKVLNSVAKIPKGISQYLKDLGKAERYQGLAKVITSIAIAVGVFAASLAVLSLVPQDNLVTLGVVLLGLVTILGTFLVIMEKIKSANVPAAVDPISKLGDIVSGPLKKLSNAALITSFGVAMALLAVAFKKMADAIEVLSGIKNVMQGVAILAGMMTFVGIMAALMQTTEGKEFDKNLSKFGTTMLKLAAAMTLMVAPIKLLSMMSLPEILLGGGTVAAIGVLFLALAKLAQDTQWMSEDISKLGSTMIKMATAITLMVIPIEILGHMNPTLLKQGGTAVGLVSVLFLLLAGLATLANDIDENISKMGTAMIKMATAVTLMIIPIELLGRMDSTQLAQGVGIVTAISTLFMLFAILSGTVLKDLSPNLTKLGAAMTLMAVAVTLLAAPVAILGKMNEDEVKQGTKTVGELTGMVVVLGIMLGVITSNQGEYVKAGIAVGIMSATLVVITGVLAMMQFLDPGKALVSAVTLGVVIGAIAASLKIVSDNEKNIIKSASCVAGIMATLLVLIPIFNTLCDFRWDQLLTASAAIVLTMGTVTAALAVLSKVIETKGGNASSAKANNLIKVAASLGIVATAMIAVAASMKLLDGIDMASLAVSFVAVNATLAAITGALILLDKFAPAAIAAAAAIGVVSASLVAIALAVNIFANTNAEGLKNVIEAFGSCSEYAGGIALMGAALIPFGAGLAVVGAAVIVLGAGLLTLIPSVMAFVAALQMMSQISAEGTENIRSLLEMLVELIPSIAAALGEGIVAIAESIIQGGPIIIEAIGLIISGIIATLSENAITIAETLTTIVTILITSICSRIVDNAPQLATAIVTVLDILIGKLGEWIPRFVEFTADLIKQVLAKIVELVPAFVEAGILVISSLITGLAEGAVDLVNAAAEALLTFINGIADAIVTYAPQFKEAGQNVIAAIVTAITGSEELGEMTKAGLQAVDGFIKGLGDGIVDVVKKAKEVGGAVLSGVKDVLQIKSPSKKMLEVGSYALEGLKNGLSQTDGVATTAKGVGTKVIEGVGSVLGTTSDNSPLKTIGSNVTEGLAEGISGSTSSVEGSGSALAQAVIDKLGNLPILSNIIGGEMGSSLLDGFFNAVGSKNDGYVGAAMPWTIDPNAKKSVEDMTEAEEDLGEATSGSGSAAKSTQKSMEELAKTYQYGKEAIEQFAIMNGEALLRVQANADQAAITTLATLKDGLKNINVSVDASVEDAEESIRNATKDINENIKTAATTNETIMTLSTQAIDNLALKLYQLSDAYKVDLANAETNTETVLKNIQASFNEVYNGITNSLKNIDIFGTFTEEEEIAADKAIANAEEWIDSMEQYEIAAQRVVQMDIPEQLKKELIATGYANKAMVEMYANATDEEVEELVYQWERAQDIQNTMGASIMATWAGNLSDISSLTFGGVTQITSMYNQGFKDGLDPNSGVDKATAMATNVITAMRNTLGIHSPSTVAFDIAGNFCKGFVNGIEPYMTPFYELGKSLMSRFMEGNRMGINLAESDLKEKAINVGRNICAGMAEGIEAGRSAVISAAIEVASAAINAAEDVLDENSPSKVFERIGKYIDLGMVNGIEGSEDQVESASAHMSEQAISGVRSSISKINDMFDDEFGEFVIRPTLDLSNIQNGVGTINGLLESQRVHAYAEVDGVAGGSTYNFTQNNYSPKALSRIDIYRQTRNQFSLMKGVR